MSKGKWIPPNSDGTLNCGDCGEAKPYTNEYFPYQIKEKGMLLKRCKKCQLIRTKKYYKGNPKYFSDYREENWEKGMKEYSLKWMRDNLMAEYNCKVYKLTAPDGNFYVGLTKYKYLSYRMRFHRKSFREDKNSQPLLHASFRKFGIKNHKMELIEELGLDRDEGELRETYWINELGATLNKNKVKKK
jgi:hypothetical protein